MSTCNFRSVQVLPAYGKNICRIIWVLNPSVNDFTKFGINVYKSRDGYTDWFKLTDAAVDPETGMITDISTGDPIYLNRDANSAVVNIPSSNTSVDINFKNRTQTFNWHYRCALVDKSSGKEIDMSPPVGIYNDLRPDQFATLRQMIKSELLSQDYHDYFICRPKGNRGMVIRPNEEVSENIDLLGEDQIGVITDDVSFGKLYEGGYSNPIKTKLLINTIKHEHIDNTEGQGSTDDVIVSITGIYYPKLIVGDLIVNPKTDDRYLFEGYSEEYYYMGRIPYKFTGIIRLVPRNQPEYKFDITNIKPCLNQPTTP